MSNEKEIIMNFLEVNNWFSLDNKENAEGIVNCYLKYYKKEKNIFFKILINFVKTILAILFVPFVMIYLVVYGFLEIGSDLFDDIIKLYKDKTQSSE
jgi:hypothetical protein